MESVSASVGGASWRSGSIATGWKRSGYLLLRVFRLCKRMTYVLCLKISKARSLRFVGRFLETLGKNPCRDRCRLAVRYPEHSKIGHDLDYARCRQEIAFRKPAVGANAVFEEWHPRFLNTRNIAFTASVNDNALLRAPIRICSPSIVRVST